jgi:uncharacterized coiled-coil protein SlyX
MEGAVKPGADLLWAFQLHREHRVLSKRLTAIEANTAKQQEQIAASEQQAHHAEKEHINALTERLRKLEDAEISEQVAGLADELRGTRQQLEQVCDKVNLVEKANKETGSKSEERDRGLQDSLGELSKVVAQLQRFAEQSEGRFKHLADHGARATADALNVSNERHDAQITGLREQLSGVDRAHDHLRTAIESVRQEARDAATIAASTSSKAPSHASNEPTLTASRMALRDKEQPQNEPQAERHVQEQEAPEPSVPQRKSNTTPPELDNHVSPIFRAAPQKPSGTTKRKRGFEKELTQLIHGDGSLTNAPLILDSQGFGPTTRGSKNPKPGAVEETSLRPAPAKRDTRSQAKVTAEPATRRAKAAAPPKKTPVAAPKPATKTTTARQAPITAVTKTQGRKGPGRSKRTPVPKQHLPLSNSSEVQVAYSQESSPSQRRQRTASRPLPCGGENYQQQQQPPQSRRRRIDQDDSMEEFLAKCQAVIGM